MRQSAAPLRLVVSRPMPRPPSSPSTIARRAEVAELVSLMARMSQWHQMMLRHVARRLLEEERREAAL